MSILTEVATGLLRLLLLAWQVRMLCRSRLDRSSSSSVLTWAQEAQVSSSWLYSSLVLALLTVLRGSAAS